MENYCGIVVLHPKLEGNVGTLFRTAVSLGNVDFIGTIGARYVINHSDTVSSPKVLPCWHFKDFDDFYNHIPMNCHLVGVELHKKSTKLEKFEHPKRAIYLFGSEDNGISNEILTKCRKKIKLPSETGISMNLSASGSIVMWDRYKQINTTMG